MFPETVDLERLEIYAGDYFSRRYEKVARVEVYVKTDITAELGGDLGGFKPMRL